MKAIVFDSFGPASVLHLADRPEPHAGAGQVRVKVKVASVNPFDTKVRAGAMEAMFKTALPAVLGSEVAGVVDEVGEGASFAIGDAIVGWAESGAYAEYALVTQAALKPAALAWDSAAAVPVAGEAAARGLRKLELKAGETLLLHGGAAAVGAFAIQLAVAGGIKVIATASPANAAFIRSLGATFVPYGDGLVSRIDALQLAARTGAPHGIDAVLDIVGKGALPDSITLRGGKSRIITIADPDAGKLGIPFAAGTAADRSVAALAEQLQRVADGSIKVVVAKTFPLADAAAAHTMSEGAHHRGKIELTF